MTVNTLIYFKIYINIIIKSNLKDNHTIHCIVLSLAIKIIFIPLII